MAVLGIDFGTAQVRAVVAPAGGEPLDAAVVSIPALVSFGDDGVRAGEPVLMTLGAVSDVLVTGIKRMLGRDPDDPLVKRALEQDGTTARIHGADLALGDAVHGVSGELTLLEGTAELLRYAADIASGRGSHEAVLTVPSWFDETQRAQLVRAARTAHIKALRLVRDTVATALWLAAAHGERGRAAVVDVGAGGMSASLLVLRNHEVRLEATCASALLGGNDIDAELAGSTPERLERRERVPLRLGCEALRRELGDAEHVEREVSVGERKIKLSLERWQLDLLLAPLRAAVTTLCRELLREAGLGPRDVELVVLTGGLGALAPVGRAVAEVFGREPERPPEGTHAAVLGAALLAGRAAAPSPGIELVDGERLPRLDDPAPAATSMLHGPVTSRRKEPERFRPPVRRSRRRRSTHPPVAGAADAPAIPAPAPTGVRPEAPPADVPDPSRVQLRSVSPKGLPAPTTAPPKSSTPSISSAPAVRSDPAIVSSPPPPDSDPLPRRRRTSSGAEVRAAQEDLALPHSGRFVQPKSARDMLAMAITRPLVHSDLDPIALPVLFRRVLSRRSVVGTLEITTSSGFSLSFDVESGSAAMTRAEHGTAQRLWDLSEGRWRLRDERQPSAGRDLYPLNRIALDGIKKMLRGLSAADLEPAFGELLNLSAQIRSERLTLPKRLGLGGRELRFIDNLLTERFSARQAMQEGTLGPTSTLQLYALLELFDALMWTEVGESQPSARAQRARRTLMGISTGLDGAPEVGRSAARRTTLGFEKGDNK